jgi:hypothetical protein
VVIPMGPWSILAAARLPLPPAFGLKGHSLVFESGTKLWREVLFSPVPMPTCLGICNR